MPSPNVSNERRNVVVALALVVAMALLAPSASAQSSDARLARVRRLVSAGEQPAARQLADSMLVVYPQGTNEYADALYARAISSTSAADAERDYLRISIEYPLSPRAEDALMMVAQLRQARGDRAGARRSFERLTRDYPTGEYTAKASFWAGRLALDDGDGSRACPALIRAQQLVSPDDVELKNQIDYYVQRCSSGVGVAARDMTPAPPVASPQPKKADAPPPKPSAAARAAAMRDSVAKAAHARDSVAKVAAAKRDSIVKAEAAMRAALRDAARDSAGVHAEPNDSTSRQAPVVRPTKPESPASPVQTAKSAKEWSVQVAAFPKERDAKALSEVLEQRGYKVRVFGDKPPYRVRVGRYATHDDALVALGKMKAKRLNGVVVEAEPQ